MKLFLLIRRECVDAFVSALLGRARFETWLFPVNEISLRFHQCFLFIYGEISVLKERHFGLLF